MRDLRQPPDVRRLQLEEEGRGPQAGQEKVQTEKFGFGRRRFGLSGTRRVRNFSERLHPDLRRPHPHRRR